MKKEQFAERLKEIRNIRCMTMTNVSLSSGIEQSQLSKYENAERLPSIENLKKLCEALYISSDVLLDIREPYKSGEGFLCLAERISARDRELIVELMQMMARNNK